MNKYLIVLVSTMLCALSCKNQSNMLKSPSGFEFERIVKGEGPKIANGEFVTFNMDVIDMKGTTQFSSKELDQPGVINIPADGNIPDKNPIIEIIAACHVGDSIKVMATPEMMGPEAGPDTVYYHIGIIETMDEEAYNAVMMAEQEKQMAIQKGIDDKVAAIYANLDSEEIQAKIQTTDSGLQYYVITEGTGEMPTVGENVNVNYYGILKRNGEMFDNSFQRGQAISFALGTGRVIPGWDEGLALLKKGSEAVLIIPSSLAYGDRDSGKIKAGDDLIFYVELLEK